MDPASTTSQASAQRTPLKTNTFEGGERVDVQNHFTCSWSSGFEVDEVIPEGDSTQLRLRRMSDRVVLPALFGENEVRRAS